MSCICVRFVSFFALRLDLVFELLFSCFVFVLVFLSCLRCCALFCYLLFNTCMFVFVLDLLSSVFSCVVSFSRFIVFSYRVFLFAVCFRVLCSFVFSRL